MSAMQEIQSHSVQALAPGTVPVAAPTSPLLPPPGAEPSTLSRPPSWDNLERSGERLHWQSSCGAGITTKP